jgi:hypothetical protein
MTIFVRSLHTFPAPFWELLKLILCKIHNERHGNEVECYAGAGERHGVNGPLKVKARIDRPFAAVKASFLRIFEADEAIKFKPAVPSYIVASKTPTHASRALQFLQFGILAQGVQCQEVTQEKHPCIFFLLSIKSRCVHDVPQSNESQNGTTRRGLYTIRPRALGCD